MGSVDNVQQQELWPTDAHSQAKEVSTIGKGRKKGRKASTPRKRIERENKITVTVIIKQAGFYGCQHKSEIQIPHNSHLLAALDKQGENRQAATEQILNYVSKNIQRLVLSVVS